MVIQTLLAIDPGKYTGCAYFRQVGEEPWCLLSVEVLQPTNVVLLHAMLIRNFPDIVLAEDFALFPWMGKRLSFDKLLPVRFLGMLEYWAYRNHRDFILVRPAERARWDDSAKKLLADLSTNMEVKGWEETPKSSRKHVVSAVAVALYYINKNGGQVSGKDK